MISYIAIVEHFVILLSFGAFTLDDLLTMNTPTFIAVFGTGFAIWFTIIYFVRGALSHVGFDI